MKKVLLFITKPELDKTSVEFLINNYSSKEVELELVTILNDNYSYVMSQIDKKELIKNTMPVFNKVCSILKDYKINKHVLIGANSAKEAMYFIKENNINDIILTKPDKYDISHNVFISYLVRHSDRTVFVLPKNNFNNFVEGDAEYEKNIIAY